jgi:hypothetical protein
MSESMDPGHGVTRRAALAAGAGGLAVAGMAPTAASAAERRLAEPRNGTAAAEVFGDIAQDGTALAGYGYLTRLAGLTDTALFTGARTEAGARFTFAASAQLRDRFLRGSLIVAIGTGTVSFYLDEGGGDFAVPGTFSDGRRIAMFSARFQNVLTVTGPNQALTTIEGELLQRQARPFSLASRRWRLGHRGLRLQLSVTGPGTRTDPTIPRAVFNVAGRLAVAG